jgi:hypothetical protein
LEKSKHATAYGAIHMMPSMIVAEIAYSPSRKPRKGAAVPAGTSVAAAPSTRPKNIRCRRFGVVLATAAMGFVGTTVSTTRIPGLTSAASAVACTLAAASVP